MTGSRVLADTNALVHFLNGDPAARGYFASLESVVLCPPVYGELVFGAMKSTRAAENMLTLAGFLRTCEMIPTDLGTSEVYARVKLGLQRKGKPIPENDVWIAALALQHELPLLSLDAHFQEIDGLELRRW